MDIRRNKNPVGRACGGIWGNRIERELLYEEIHAAVFLTNIKIFLRISTLDARQKYIYN